MPEPSPPSEPPIPDLTISHPPRILIPVAVLEGQTISGDLVEFLARADLVVLGYHVLPEQTPTEQASMQFEDRAQQAVDDIAANFEDADGTLDTRVVFTHDRDQTVERVADEVEATAVLFPNPTGPVRNVLVSVRGEIDTPRLTDLIGTLVRDEEISVTLWGVVSEASTFEADTAVDEAYNRLLAAGLGEEQVRKETSVAEHPVHEIVERSSDFDAIVMGEGGDSLVSMILGEDAERVAEGAIAPVLVVRAASTT